MTETPKQLAQIACTASLIDLYTATATTIVSSIIICNQTGAPTDFDIVVLPAADIGGGVLTKHYIYKLTVLPQNNTFVANLGLVIASGTKIKVRSSVNVSVYAAGIEVTA